MIYFIADWDEQVNSLETDKYFNLIKNFEQSSLEFNVIVPKCVPFLRYLTAEFGLAVDNRIINILDNIQNITITEDMPASLKNLRLNNDIELVHTDKEILLYKQNILWGKIEYNRFGFIRKVHYFKKEEKRIDTYSDKGFIINSSIFNVDGSLINKNYFDSSGKIVFYEDPLGVHIMEYAMNKFRSHFYKNMDEIYKEFVLKALESFNPLTDYLVLSGENTWLNNVIKEFPFINKVIYTHLGDDIQGENNVLELNQLVHSKALVTDNVSEYRGLILTTKDKVIQEKIHLIPTYATKLNLGRSNTIAEQYVYWNVGVLDENFINLYNDTLKLRLDDEGIRFIINVELSEDRSTLQNLTMNFVENILKVSVVSENYRMIEKYFDAERKQRVSLKMQKQFDEAKATNPNFPKDMQAYNLIHGLSYRVQPTTKEIEDDLTLSRIYVNYQKKNDDFVQAMVVSSGIPLIAQYDSIYLIDGMNGKTYSSNEKLMTLLNLYLSTPGIWNESLIESVAQLEKNSAQNVKNKWEELLNGESN